MSGFASCAPNEQFDPVCGVRYSLSTSYRVAVRCIGPFSFPECRHNHFDKRAVHAFCGGSTALCVNALCNLPDPLMKRWEAASDAAHTLEPDSFTEIAPWNHHMGWYPYPFTVPHGSCFRGLQLATLW